MPRRFPIFQAPNRSLLVSLGAGLLARRATGDARRYAGLLSRLALVIWAAGEVRSGANWFRRLLGLGAGGYALRALGRSFRA
jgi:hypothetical protein